MGTGGLGAGIWVYTLYGARSGRLAGCCGLRLLQALWEMVFTPRMWRF